MSWQDFQAFLRIKCKSRPGGSSRTSTFEDPFPWAKLEEIYRRVVAERARANVASDLSNNVPKHEVANVLPRGKKKKEELLI
jgi:hypothetical protein